MCSYRAGSVKNIGVLGCGPGILSTILQVLWVHGLTASDSGSMGEGHGEGAHTHSKKSPGDDS